MGRRNPSAYTYTRVSNTAVCIEYVVLWWVPRIIPCTRYMIPGTSTRYSGTVLMCIPAHNKSRRAGVLSTATKSSVENFTISWLHCVLKCAIYVRVSSDGKKDETKAHRGNQGTTAKQHSTQQGDTSRTDATTPSARVQTIGRLGLSPAVLCDEGYAVQQ